jgi:hypothetical protein
MVHVTERAKEMLLRKKQSLNIHGADIGLRLASTATGRLTLAADRMKAGDQVVVHKDSTVLLVDPQRSQLVLAGSTVDCRETEDGKVELVLRRLSAGGQATESGQR